MQILIESLPETATVFGMSSNIFVSKVDPHRPKFESRIRLRLGGILDDSSLANLQNMKTKMKNY